MEFTEDEIASIIAIASVLYDKSVEARGSDLDDEENHRILRYAVNLHKKGMSAHQAQKYVGDLLTTFNERQEKLAPKNPELVGKILQSQLKVEFHVYELLDAFYPGLPTKKLNISFSKAITAVAFRPEMKPRQHLIRALRDTAKIRNEFAHNLSHNISHDDVNGIKEWFILLGFTSEELDFEKPLNLYFEACEALAAHLHTWRHLVKYYSSNQPASAEDTQPSE